MKFIVDTNVPLNAADLSKENSLDVLCSIECLKFIKDLMQCESKFLVLDYGGDIFREYYTNLKSSRQNTVATQFLNWVQRNLTLTLGSRIEQCPITKTGENEYDEFPDSNELIGFDISDRKFIALSMAHNEHPTIIQGSDTLWWRYKEIFERFGVSICFLHEDYMIDKCRDN